MIAAVGFSSRSHSRAHCCVLLLEGLRKACGMRNEKSQNEWASSILKTLIFIELSIGVDRFRLRNIFWRIMLSIQITKASAWADNVSVRKVFFLCSFICPNPLSFCFFFLFWLVKFSERFFSHLCGWCEKREQGAKRTTEKKNERKSNSENQVRKQKQQQQQQDKKNF